MKEKKRKSKSRISEIVANSGGQDWDRLPEETRLAILKEEKEERDALKTGFNIVKEEDHVMVLAANRVEISRKWAKRLLKISFYFNIVTLTCFVISIGFVLTKPQPEFYASTPSGKIIGPLGKVNLKK